MRDEMSLRTHVRKTLRLAGPLAIAQFATFAMGLVDTACVGRFSEEALGAVAIGNALHWTFASVALGIPLSLDPLISQSIGSNRPHQAFQWLLKGLKLLLVVGVPLIGLELLLATDLTLFGMSEELADTAFNYLLCRSPGLVFFQMFLAGRAYLQSHEITRPILMAAVVANVVNLILDVFLVFGDRALEGMGLPGIGLPALGEIGAGLTTTASTMTLCAYVLWRVWKVRPTEVVKEPDTTSLMGVARLAWPVSLQQISESWLFCIFGILVGRFGAEVAGGHQVALTLAASAFMLALGISSATSVRVGHAVGAGSLVNTRRAAAAGVIIVLMSMGTTAIVFLLIPKELVSLLTNQEGVINVAAPLLAFAAAFALFDGIQVVISGALRGAGDVRVPFILGIIAYWGVGGTLSWFAMNSELQVKGIWLGLVAGLTTASILLSCRFLWLIRRPIASVTGEAE
jgi:MATE family multidrug resistance protein